jgi:phage tail sheath protein FI
MPVQPTYPGVYIEEIASGIRTITGVATSITAFVGRARSGPVNEPVTLNSYGDFERIFGGLWADSSLGYAVRDFYLNGGSQAIVVRLFREDAAAGAPSSHAALSLGGTTHPLTLEAADPGTWGSHLSAQADNDVSLAVAQSLGLVQADLFNLTVREDGGSTETFRNLTVKDTPRRIDRVLAAQSQLVRWKGPWPAGTAAAPLPDVPTPVGDDLSEAKKALKTAQDALQAAQAASPANPAAVTAAQTAVTAAQAKVTAVQPLHQGADGLTLQLGDLFDPTNGQTNKTGVFALEKADLFNLLCIPPYLSTGDVDVDAVNQAAAYCESRRAMLLVDPPSAWTTKVAAKNGIAGVGTVSKNAALFFPRLRESDPLRNNQLGDFAPCGAVAGVFARTDAQRGIWKAPAGLDATLAGVQGLTVPLTDGENGELNPLGVNCLRIRPAVGPVVWGARTLQGDDRLASEWKYIPVRRMALYLEESLYRGTQWVVFEPNDEPLWAQIRLNIGAFMQGLFRQGAFQGKTPREAYLVKCDKETTTQNDINSGIVNIVVGFAPLKPAEFVIIQLQQLAGQVQA